MEISEKDNKTRRPYEHYLARCRELPSGDITARTGLVPESGAYLLRLLGRDVRVDAESFEMDCKARLSAAEQILLLRYLSGGAYVPTGGRFLAYRDVPWGQVYAANFQGRCIMRLAGSFGYDRERFARGLAALGACPVDMGDAAGELEFLPGMLLRLALWYGDDEFPPSAQILFSDNFPAAFSAEDMAVVGDVTLDALKLSSSR